MGNKTQNQFLSSAIYQEIVPVNSFWRKVREVIDWSKWTEQLSQMYSNKLGGNSNWPVEMMLKILLIQRVYNTSDRKTEEMCTQNIMVKFFLGLEISAKAPDYSVISRFRSTVLKVYGPEFYEEFFQEILLELTEAGLQFGTTSVVDSTITDADVNTWKEKERVDNGSKARDTDAGWTRKSRPSKEGGYHEDRYYYGYKSHTAVDIDSQIVTAVIPTSANKHDGHYLYELVNKTKILTNHVDSVVADKGYDDSFLIHQLEEEGIKTAIGIRKSRLSQADIENEMYWRTYVADESRRKLYKRRGEGERVFADQKRNHGLDRCIYIGIDKYKMQSYLTAAAYNLKIGIRLLFGIKLSIA